jgi:hypothetical protein
MVDARTKISAERRPLRFAFLGRLDDEQRALG